MLLALLLSPAWAALPLPTFPECGEPDRPDLCPDDLEEEWNYLSYVPGAWQEGVREAELALGSGMWIDRAWRTTTGRTDVVVAVLDSGIKWDERSLLDKAFLNLAELPFPEGAESWDTNGDGVVTVSDWAGDTRVAWDAGVDVADDVLDPSDLIATFSDGVDDDDNGYIDDISGWDFLWDDNDPYDDVRFGHGTGEARDVGAEGGDGDGRIGACPNCMILNLRVADGFVADLVPFTQGVGYATDNGAAVMVDALGAITAGPLARAVIDDAWEHGALVIGSAGDEHAWHPNPPGSYPHTFYVHALRYDGDEPDESRSFLAYSNCTNHGARLDGSAASEDCSSGATGMTAGIAGLVVSAARDAGWEPTPAELHALLSTTVDDVWVTDLDDVYPSLEGWDRTFGHGRLNAAAAVAAAQAGPPPVADIESPDWFLTLDTERTPAVEVRGVADAAALSSWTLSWGEGIEPTTWTELASGTRAVNGPLATWSPSPIDAELTDHPRGADAVDREDRVNLFTATLRLVVTDQAGRTTTARRAVYLRADPDVPSGWPLRLAGSLEASPTLVDLDGDGVLDVIQADGGGAVYALRGDGSALPGWPVYTGVVPALDATNSANHRAAPVWSRLEPTLREAVAATPAAADLDGDGSVEVVVATMQGGVWVFEPDGSVRDGFPVRQAPAGPTTPDERLGEGFLASPALVDLDGDGALEIVLAGFDQRVYAWRADGGDAPGWPVHAATEEGGTKIVSPPAFADIDGDGDPEVLLGTNEMPSDTLALLYAFHGDGSPVEGWPSLVSCLSTDILPLVGEGFPDAVAFADFDGDGLVSVVAHGMTGKVEELDVGGETLRSFSFVSANYGGDSNVSDAAAFPLINSPSLGDLDNDGVVDVVTGATGSGYLLAQANDGERMPFDHAVGAWSGATGEMLPGWPRLMEDINFFQNPAVADLDGDGAMEVVTGTGGFLLHAWDQDGLEPAGWPKLVGQWIIASPAVGDIDGDGFLDVVVGARDGTLWRWTTPSPATAKVAWPMFGRDPTHSRDATAALPGYPAGGDDTGAGPKDAEGCGCGTREAPAWWLVGAGVLGLGWRRRRVAGV